MKKLEVPLNLQTVCLVILEPRRNGYEQGITAYRRQWAKRQRARLEHIQPGKPQQNTYIERNNRTVRGELLGQYNFKTIEEAQEQATEWPWTYDNERPNIGIGGITPAIKLKKPPEFYG